MECVLQLVVVIVVLVLNGFITIRRKYKGTLSMNCRKRGSYARGVYLHTGYLAHRNSKSDARGRSRQKSNSYSSMTYEKLKVLNKT